MYPPTGFTAQKRHYPVIENFTTDTAGGGDNTITLAVPAGTQDGDLLVAYISHDDGTSISSQAAWTNEQSQSFGLGYSYIVESRVASSEPANYTWSVVGASTSFGVMLRIPKGSGVLAANAGPAQTSGTSIPTASAVPGENNFLALVIAFGNKSAAGSLTTPTSTGMSEVVTIDGSFNGRSDLRITLFEEVQIPNATYPASTVEYIETISLAQNETVLIGAKGV